MRTRYSDFVLIAGVESPLVVYMRKDTPPGVNVAADLMKTKDFKALSLNVQNTNTHQHGARARPARGQVPGGAGLSRPEGRRDRDPAEHRADGQLVAVGLERPRSSRPWDTSSSRCGNSRRAPRTAAIRAARRCPNLQTFEEFYASVFPGKTLAGQLAYEALRAFADPQLAMFRVALMPPKASDEAIGILRSAFAEMWKNPQFLADYSRVIKTEPILVSGSEGQEILADLGKVRPEIKDYLVDYMSRMTSK